MYKKEEGLGIRYMQIWNLAAVGKITWHISTMQDSLWVKWVHEVHMKGGRWDLFNAPYHYELGAQKTMWGEGDSKGLDEKPEILHRCRVQRSNGDHK